MVEKLVENFMVEKFMIEKFMVEKVMVEKFMAEKSGVEDWGWTLGLKNLGWNVKQPFQDDKEERISNSWKI